MLGNGTLKMVVFETAVPKTMAMAVVRMEFNHELWGDPTVRQTQWWYPKIMQHLVMII